MSSTGAPAFWSAPNAHRTCNDGGMANRREWDEAVEVPRSLCASVSPSSEGSQDSRSPLAFGLERLRYTGLCMSRGGRRGRNRCVGARAYDDAKPAPKNDVLRVVPSVGFVRGTRVSLSGTF
jgi:hypothetical protein